MALAQPTNLEVQLLEPLISVQQSVQRDVLGDCRTLTTEGELALLTESGEPLSTELCLVKLVTLFQLIDETNSAVIRLGHTLATLEQTIITLAELPQQPLVTLSQSVERIAPASRLLRLRQSVLAEHVPGATLPIKSRIYLDDADISEACSPAIEVTASEGDNRTAVVTYRPPSGPINITSFQGRALEIRREIAGQWVPIFTGTVDVPRYDREQRTLRFQCSDLRGERLGRVNRDTLRSLTGGLFSPITQREDASGEAWVRELLKTVEGSLDYTSAGALRFRPWAVGTPRYTLPASDIHHREIRLEFATRSEIVNAIKGKLEYRYYQRNTFEHEIDLIMQTQQYALGPIGWDGTGLPASRNTIPTKEALRSALNVANWHVADYVYKRIPPNGWYRLMPTSNPTSFFATNLLRDLRAMGIEAQLERYISQPKREVYDLTVTAPESVDQFGEIGGSDMRFAVESRVDPSIFEERGCVIIADPDDRRADVNLAIQCMQKMAAKTIKAGHRQNSAAFRYKPADGDLLPIEIGDTVTVSNSEIVATGFVAELSHVVTREHDRYTDVRLALSRVDSAVTATENWQLPAQPTQYRLSETAQPTMTPDCPLPADAVTADGESRIEPDGTVYVVTPSIDRRDVDEIVGTREQSYSVAIPRNNFTVEVP